MLKVVGCLSNGLKSKSLPVHLNFLKRQVIPAHVSTNTAINRSLRRSQYDTKRSERRSTDLGRRPVKGSASGRRPQDQERTFGRHMTDSDAPRGRRQRPIYEEPNDVENVRELAGTKKIHRTQRRLRRPLRMNEKGFFDRSTRGAKHNYEPHPEGNRALRRALKFGHHVKSTVSGRPRSGIRQEVKLDSSREDKFHNSKKDLVENIYSKSTPHRGVAFDREEEQGRGFSMPEELQDAIDPSIEGFTIKRHLSTPRGASYGNQPGEQEYAVPSRASGRGFESYGRNPSPADDQQSRRRDANIPLSIPYTTPASEFLYGKSAITAALLSPRRKLYKLYIYAGANREAIEQDLKIRELALKRSVVVERVKEDGLRLMSKMSAGRPHNGYILEASPLPKLPVAGFQAVEKRNGAFHVILDHQSREEEAVNGTNTDIEYKVSFPRYPFVLLLDGILDPGNLGAILRTAFFLGVDTVAISNRTSAPVSPIAIKASAGAAEALPLVSVSKPGNFIDQCKGNGWKIYAAAAPTPGKRTGLGKFLSTSNLGDCIRNQPCLLILGGEGEGLHKNIRRKADFDVGINGSRIGQSNVDSLNVSVAAGLLCEAFLRNPTTGRAIDVDGPSDTDEWENRVF